MLFQISPLVNGTPVRFDVQGRYCLNDLHKAAGGEKRHQPSDFLRTESASALVQALETEQTKLREFPELKSAPVNVVIGRGKAQGTYVCRELVYAYAAWINADFHLMILRTFDTAVLLAQQRIESKISFKAVSEAINQATLARKGEAAQQHHYILENNLLLRLSLGQSKAEFCKEHGIDPKHFRDWLAVNAPLALEKLDFLSKHDETLLATGLAYDQRKEALGRLLETRFKSKFTALAQQAQAKLN